MNLQMEATLLQELIAMQTSEAKSEGGAVYVHCTVYSGGQRQTVHGNLRLHSAESLPSHTSGSNNSRFGQKSRFRITPCFGRWI